ncbi:hypothetical protein N656DRAFT_804894 [Canariomyces notabilis]|uniref:HD domain-containing protein n=1 Tax=Canariomyces notabilis TaxID=2074819 RepID=A0AAN6TPA1_9PEZI|nr:hypothetical protein N656DRAFT_804894 [Canariomyces arenarius]
MEAKHSVPRRTIAGISVIDTPLVRAAQQYAREHGNDELYKHVMRSWLWGVLVLQHNSTLAASVDEEVHALAALFHDLGLDPTGELVSTDRRFEVDGAIAAREFIRTHAHSYGNGSGRGGRGRRWDERRVQLVWDAIALHSEQRIALFKEDEVVLLSHGVVMDFTGPNPALGVEQGEYDAVLEEFPKVNLTGGWVETMQWLCRTKPATTYETFMQGYGDEYVPGYSAVGHRMVDRIVLG